MSNDERAPVGFVLHLDEGGDISNGPEPDNPFREFLESAALAAHIGYPRVNALDKATAVLDRRAQSVMLKTGAPTSDLDETVVPDSLLAKADSSHSWITSRMAKSGKTANEVVDAWVAEFAGFPNRNPEIEADLRRVAAQIDAA